MLFEAALISFLKPYTCTCTCICAFTCTCVLHYGCYYNQP